MHKRYFFRDKTHEGNLNDGTTYHAAGIVMSVESIEPSHSGKDLAVYFLHPFLFSLEYTWRSYDEVELFEVAEEDWQYAKNRYCAFRDLENFNEE